MPADQRGPQSTAEVRNRVDMLPDIVRSLRAGESVHAPGYDTATRNVGDEVNYDPNGTSVIVLDGIFGGHQSIRNLLDYLVFVTMPVELQRARFVTFYRWKGLDENAIELLWKKRVADEWPAVDRQRDSADFILTAGSSLP